MRKLFVILLEIILNILVLPIAILYGLANGIFSFFQLIHVALWSDDE